MARRLFTLLSALSLLLCLAAGALWVRSHWRKDIMGRRLKYALTSDQEPAGLSIHDWDVGSREGRVWLRRRCQRYQGETALYYFRRLQRKDPADGVLFAYSTSPRSAWGPQTAEHWMFRYETYGGGGSAEQSESRLILVPHWALVATFAPLPAAWFHWRRGVRRRQRARERLCLRCGYDLRATPGRCPECGTLAGREA